ncbi:hypothetical protein HOY80DRAFT_965770 [Tuber brumale]|nr:hypothetical protein HOY80DRAFT_965770 [Tuber brumale]
MLFGFLPIFVILILNPGQTRRPLGGARVVGNIVRPGSLIPRLDSPYFVFRIAVGWPLVVVVDGILMFITHNHRIIPPVLLKRSKSMKPNDVIAHGPFPDLKGSK